MTNKTMTYTEALTIAINTLGACEATDRLTALRATIEKKNSNRATGLTKNQKENEAIKELIVAGMGADNSYTATEIGTVVLAGTEFEGISTSKSSALLKQLVAEGKVVREEAKGKATFRLV